MTRFQPKASGQTAYRSLRGKYYSGQVVPFGERVLFRTLAYDKFEERWSHGVFVGKIEQMDEFVLVTPSGVAKSRGVRRLEEGSRYDLPFLRSCNGLPWLPKATAADLGPGRGDPLQAGARIKRMYITQSMIDKHGRTDGCPLCENWGSSHNERCRQREEKLMLQTGDAFELPAEKVRRVSPEPAAVEVAAPEPPCSRMPSASPPPEATSSSSSGTTSTDSSSEVLALSPGFINEVRGLVVEPRIELWRDGKAWFGQKFPRDAQQRGRERELQNILEFEAVEDTTLEEGDQVWDMIWVADWRGEEVRSRLCVRQYNDSAVTDLFAATPDSFFQSLSTCAPEYGCEPRLLDH